MRRCWTTSSSITASCDSARRGAAARARAVNPKRMQREARKQMQSTGIGTRSQQALKLQQEQFKQERKARTREEKLDEAKRMFALKQQKKKDKHRGH